MSVPGDPTPEYGFVAHGLPTRMADNVTQLETGYYTDGNPIVGMDGHSGVFEEGSTAWENMLAVMLEQPVLLDSP